MVGSYSSMKTFLVYRMVMQLLPTPPVPSMDRRYSRKAPPPPEAEAPSLS